MSTAATAVAEPRVELIPLTLLHESPTNPRKTFVPTEVEELAQSLKDHGVLQHILVRPWPKKAGEFEIVFGAKRYRAARLAKLDQLPASIREMSDAQVLETQLIENDKRSDIHPMEQAEAYEQLHAKFGYSVDDIAAKVGKSRASVYARMKLCALVPEARKAFADGKLNPSTALLVARIPVPSLQKQATKEITEENRFDGAMSVRQAAEHVQGKYMLRLVEAPFDRADPQLKPKAGACTTCPKRTGNQAELFDDVKSADVCTDPGCYAEKSEAAWDKRAEEAKAKGLKVLSEAETKKLFPYPHISNIEGHVDLDAKCYDDPKQRKWKTLLGKNVQPQKLARTEDGKVHELVPVDQAKKALKAAGHKFGAGDKPDSDYDKEKRERAQTAKRLRAMQTAALTEIVACAETQQPDDTWARLFLLAVLDQAAHEAIVATVKRRALSGSDEKGALRKAIGGMSGAQLRGLAVELVAYSHIGSYNTSLGPHFQAFAKLYDVTPKAPPAKEAAPKKKGGAK